MPFFSAIDDELTRELTEDYAEVFSSIRSLMRLLDVDSYDEMGDQEDKAQQLLSAESELAAKLRHPLGTCL